MPLIKASSATFLKGCFSRYKIIETAIFDDTPGSESSSLIEAELIFNLDSGGALSSTQLTEFVRGIDSNSLKPVFLLLYLYKARAQITDIRHARKMVS